MTIFLNDHIPAQETGSIADQVSVVPRMGEVVVKNTLIYNQSSQNYINCVQKQQLVVVICYEWWLN